MQPSIGLIMSNIFLILNCLIMMFRTRQDWKPDTGNRTLYSGPETTGELQLWRIKKKSAEW